MATRDYKKEYAEYHGKPEQIANRAERVKARRMMEKTGAAKKGDGKDVDHIRPLSKGGTSAKTNLRMRSVKANRGDK
ncbi:MAG: HNH endonuclease [Gammaproteobacteria bacterium]|jgi:ribosomal protein S17|nr:HNH endonuclease [Gammaproteobacteria bacterium]